MGPCSRFGTPGARGLFFLHKFDAFAALLDRKFAGDFFVETFHDAENTRSGFGPRVPKFVAGCSEERLTVSI